MNSRFPNKFHSPFIFFTFFFAISQDERDLSYQNPPAPYYIEDDEVLYNLNLNNPMIPTSTGATPQQFALQQGGSPQQVAQQLQLSPQPIHMSAQQPQVSYL